MGADQGIKPGNLPAHGPLLQGIFHMPYYHLKSEIHILPAKFIPLGFEFLKRKILKRIFHTPFLRSQFQIGAGDKLGLDRQLGPGQIHGFFGQGLFNTPKLKHNRTGLNDGYPVFRGALTLTHTGFSGFLGIGLIRENPNPHLAAPLDMAVQGDTGGLNLPIGDPHPAHSHQGIIAENNGVSPGRVPGHISPLYFAEFYTFGT
jgi:hypothetical protein